MGVLNVCVCDFICVGECIYICGNIYILVNTCLYMYMFVCMLIYIHIFMWVFTNPSTWVGFDTRSIFWVEFNWFEFFLTGYLIKAKEPGLPYHLSMVENYWIPRVLVLCEMYKASSRIWTCVAMSISYNDIHYTTGKVLLWTPIHGCTNVDQPAKTSSALRRHWMPSNGAWKGQMVR